MTTSNLSDTALTLLDRLTTPEGWPMASMPPSSDEPIGRYACLFGRDSLITALQVLPIRPAMAQAVLEALGNRRGRKIDMATHEEPGKILHEDRIEAPSWMIPAGWPVVSDGSMRYFGSVDSTPLFLILAAHTSFSGLAVEEALEWLLRALQPTGLLTYVGHEYGGLPHQGWRDELHGTPGMGVRWPDGHDIDRPVAVASAQGWAFNALMAHGLNAEADALAGLVEQTFFAHGEPWPALAVDGNGKAVPMLTSEIGILLWSGILRAHRVQAAVTALDRLASPWGLYTVAPEYPVFSPTSYHYGAIWPFDCWFAWGGLRDVGAYDRADKLRQGVLRAIKLLGGMPECYAAPLDGNNPFILPEATRNQAWTAGAVWALEHDWDGR